MKIKEVILEEEAFKVIREDAESSFPNECCGFFYGDESETGRTISLAVPVENSKEGDQRRRFEISPLAYMKAERFADEQGLKLLGVYHSHPQHPAWPSEHDRVQAMPWFSYIIVSVIDGKLTVTNSFQLNEEFQFEQEALKVLTATTEPK